MVTGEVFRDGEGLGIKGKGKYAWRESVGYGVNSAKQAKYHVLRFRLII